MVHSALLRVKVGYHEVLWQHRRCILFMPREAKLVLFGLCKNFLPEIVDPVAFTVFLIPLGSPLCVLYEVQHKNVTKIFCSNFNQITFYA